MNLAKFPPGASTLSVLTSLYDLARQTKNPCMTNINGIHVLMFYEKPDEPEKKIEVIGEIPGLKEKSNA